MQMKQRMSLTVILTDIIKLIGPNVFIKLSLSISFLCYRSDPDIVSSLNWMTRNEIPWL